MNKFFASALKGLLATALWACFVVFLGFFAKCISLLFALGWGVL